MGPELIRVEPPGTGHDTRGWGPPFAAGEAAYFLGVNRNKRSVVLNMAAPAGQKVLRELIEKAEDLGDSELVHFLAVTQLLVEERATSLTSGVAAFEHLDTSLPN